MSVLEVRGAALQRGDRTIWSGLDLAVQAGEFIAILGPSGAGKTTLLRAILGLQPLSAGTITVNGKPVTRGNGDVGYVPQQHPFAKGTAARGRDIVTLGITGTRWGVPIPPRGTRERVDAVLHEVGAQSYADRPIGELSGGEQQRLRVGQALVNNPDLLLCDEPLSNLDLANQRGVSSIIDAQAERGAAVLFVTHDINPVLDRVDRIVYLANGQALIGTPQEVLTSEVLTRVYGSRVEVYNHGGHIVVAGLPDEVHAHEAHLHGGHLAAPVVPRTAAPARSAVKERNGGAA